MDDQIHEASIQALEKVKKFSVETLAADNNLNENQKERQTI